MLKILLAEDNIILGDFLEEFLTSQGHQVCGVAQTVEQAVILADLHKPDLGIFDFRLAHGQFGSEIGPRLKDKREMGILYVSGDPLEDKLTSADGEAYIQKPYGMKDLDISLRIVDKIKRNIDVPSALFPSRFHLLDETRHSQRKSAA